MRFSQDPFPLYLLEELYEEVRELRVLSEHEALVLRAEHDTVEKVRTEEGFFLSFFYFFPLSYSYLPKKGETIVSKEAGDEWMFRGPGTYYPNAKITIVREIRATVINPDTGYYYCYFVQLFLLAIIII